MPIPAAASPAASDPVPPLTVRGEARFWRISFALFLSGLATFALLYCVQPMLPAFVRAFSLTPAAASLSLSVATAVLAVAMFGAGALSDAYGRKTVMAISLAAAAAATLAAAFAPNWPTLIVLRALTGLALSGAPAIAMAYLAEEMDRSAVGLSMGLFIAGNTLGGMGGRLAAAAMAEFWGWRSAMGVIGAVSLVCAAAFTFALPRERRATPKAELIAIGPAIRMHLGDPGLRLLYALGFLLMGAFVTTYNYIGFHLAAPPFSLSQTAIGFVFVIYLLGAVASAVAGDLAGRYRPQAGHPARGRLHAARRPCDAVQQSLGDHFRRRDGDCGVFRRAFDRVELGRVAHPNCARAGQRALSVLLLRRIEPRGLGRRLGARGGWLVRRGGLSERAHRPCAYRRGEAQARGAACPSAGADRACPWAAPPAVVSASASDAVDVPADFMSPDADSRAALVGRKSA